MNKLLYINKLRSFVSVSFIVVLFLVQIACLSSLPVQTPSSGVATILALTTTPGNKLPIPLVPPTITQTLTSTQVITEIDTPIPAPINKPTNNSESVTGYSPIFSDETKIPDSLEPLSIKNVLKIAELKRIGMGKIVNIEFSGDNHYIGVETLANRHIFDAQSLQRIEYESDLWSTEFGPKANDLQAELFQDGVFIVNALEKVKIAQLKEAIESSFSFSDDQRLVVGKISPKDIGVWETESGKLIRKMDLSSSPVDMVCNEFIGVTISPTGEHVAAGCVDNNIGFVWRVSDAVVIDSIKTDNSNIIALNFSGNGKLIGTISSDSRIQLWNTQNGRLQKILEPQIHSQHISGGSIAFSRDGYYLVSGFDNGELLVWRISDGKLLRKISYPSYIMTQQGEGLGVSSSGELISIVSFDQVAIYKVNDGSFYVLLFLAHENNVDSGESIAPIERKAVTGQVRTIDSSMINPLMAVGFDEQIDQIRVYKYDGNDLDLIQTPGIPLFVRFVNHNEKLIIVTTGGTLIYSIDKINSSDFIPPKQVIDLIDCAAVSPDGAYIALGRENSGIEIWSVIDAKIIKEIEIPKVTSLQFSPGGQFFLYTTDTTLEAVDTNKWETLKSRSVEGRIMTLSADGSLILLTKPFGGFSIIEIDQLAELISIDLGYQVMDAVFHPANQWFATASQDGIVRIWGIPPER